MSSSVHFPDADNFQRQADEFLAWLSQKPGVRISPKIQVTDLRGQAAGRGVGMFLNVILFVILFCLRGEILRIVSDLLPPGSY